MITKNLLQIRENTEYRGNKEEFYNRGNTDSQETFEKLIQMRSQSGKHKLKKE